MYSQTKQNCGSDFSKCVAWNNISQLSYSQRNLKNFGLSRVKFLALLLVLFRVTYTLWYEFVEEVTGSSVSQAYLTSKLPLCLASHGQHPSTPIGKCRPVGAVSFHLFCLQISFLIFNSDISLLSKKKKNSAREKQQK